MGNGNWVIVPVVVIRPIPLTCCSVNQRLPSGPTVMPLTPLWAVGTANRVTV